MIIRSQDKKSITTDLNLCIYEDDWTHQFEVSNNIGMELGLYSTEEKAIKVLDMICHFADKVHLEKLQSNPIRTDGTVFQMPLDEDVEV